MGGWGRSSTGSLLRYPLWSLPFFLGAQLIMQNVGNSFTRNADYSLIEMCGLFPRPWQFSLTSLLREDVQNALSLISSSSSLNIAIQRLIVLIGNACSRSTRSPTLRGSDSHSFPLFFQEAKIKYCWFSRLIFFPIGLLWFTKKIGFRQWGNELASTIFQHAHLWLFPF